MELVALEAAAGQDIGDAAEVSAFPATLMPTAGDTAVDFLKALDPVGWHNLVAADPAEKRPPWGRTFAPGDWTGMKDFVDIHDGVANLYFSANEPKAGSPNKKLDKDDVAALRFLYVDIDPAKDADLGAERRRLSELEGKVASGMMPATFSIDSGGGVQLLWRLSHKMPVDEASTSWAESFGKGLAQMLNGDNVQNIDRLLRLPGTTNLPTESKRARGRIVAPARLIRNALHVYDQATIEARVVPASSSQKVHDEALVTAAAEEIAGEDYGVTAELQKRFDAAIEKYPRLRAVWDGDPVGLAGPDNIGSGWRGSLARRMAEVVEADFSALDFARMVHAWTHPAIDPHKLTDRNLARDWGRCAAPYSPAEQAARWLDEEPTPLFPSDDEGEEHRAAATGLEWIDPHKWADKPIPEREWEVGGLIPRGEVTLMYGDGGVGKTLLIHQYAVAAATGVSWLDLETRPAKVLCLFCEDGPEELQRRHADIIAALGVDYGATEGRLRISSRRYLDNLLALWDRNTGAMKRQAVWEKLRNDAVAFGADVIILDTLADFYAGEEQNRAQVTAFVKSCLGALARDIGGSVITLGHPSMAGKSSGQGTSGSTAWSNAVRSRLYLRYPKGVEKGNIRELEGMKLNYGAKGALVKLRWQRGAFVPIASSVASVRDGNQPAAGAPTVENACDQAVLDAIVARPDARMNAHAKTGAYCAMTVLKRLEPELLAPFSTSEVETSLQRLMAADIVISVEIGRDTARRVIPGLRVTDKKSTESAPEMASAFY
jgi:hypothetical protein